MIADDPSQKIELKAFHVAILNDHEVLQQEQRGYKPILVVRQVTPAMIHRNYAQIRHEIEDLVNAEMEWIMSDPGLGGPY
jgi:hypothetical protein